MVDPRIAKASGTPRTTANRLRQVRVAAQLSQRQLAALSGVSRLAIIMIERGDTRPQSATIAALAQALDVDPLELVSPPRGANADA